MIDPIKRKAVIRLIQERCPMDVIAEDIGVDLDGVYAIRREAGMGGVRADPSPAAIWGGLTRRIRDGRTPLQTRRSETRKPEPWTVPEVAVCEEVADVAVDALWDATAIDT